MNDHEVGILYQKIKSKQELAGEDPFVISELWRYPFSITIDCMTDGDLDTYKIICKLVIILIKTPWFDTWIHNSYLALANRDKWQFLYVLMSVPGANKIIRDMDVKENHEWYGRYFIAGPWVREYEKELELIERLDQSPLVKAIVKGFLFPN
jgi:hypothetical protein